MKEIVEGVFNVELKSFLFFKSSGFYQQIAKLSPNPVGMVYSSIYYQRMPKPVHLEGTNLEGDGQLLRLAIGFSALTNTALHLTKIRGNRRGKCGLKLQHLKAVEWLGCASSAETEGAEVASLELRFQPLHRSTLAAREFAHLPAEIDIGSPGSVCLVAQAILPYLLFAGYLHPSKFGNSLQRKVTINGGTNVSMSPSVDYLQHVLFPILSKIGLPLISLEIHRRGWTRGRTQLGSITITTTPLPLGSKLPSWSLTDRGPIIRIEAYGLVPGPWKDLLEHEVTVQISKTFGDDMDIKFRVEPTNNMTMYYLLLVAVSENDHRLGRDWLFDEKVKPNSLEKIPLRLARRFVGEIENEISHGGCVDEYMRDQLVVFQALADGKCQIDVGEGRDGSIKASLHAQTVEWVAEEILGVRWKKNGCCEGIGFFVEGPDMT